MTSEVIAVMTVHGRILTSLRRIRMTLTARHTLLIDAVATTATALLMFAGRGLLYPYFGLQSPLVLDVAATAFLVYAAIIALAARREDITRTTLMATAAANGAYVVASAAMLVLFWSELQPVGRALIVVVALAVEAFAMLQFAAGRRLTNTVTQPA
jgi:hypothetical protein